MKHPILIVFFFLTLFLLISIAVLQLFGVYGSNGNGGALAISKISDAIGVDIVDIELWSTLSDILAVVLGVPVSLAGAIVAIYIAQQAFLISRRQEYYESTAYIEKIVDEAAQIFWDFASAVRDLDLKYTRALSAASRISNTKDTPSKELQDDFVVTCLDLDESIIQLSETFLTILRNPICKTSFEITISKRNRSIIKDIFNFHRATMEQKTSNLPIMQLGHDFEGLKVHGLNFGLSKRSSHLGRKFGFLKVEEKSLMEFDPLNPKPQDERVNPSRLNERGATRLKSIGAFISFCYFGHDRDGRKYWCNIGAATLAEILLGYPDERSILYAAKVTLKERGIKDKASLELAERVVKDKSITNFLPRWIIDAADALSDDYNDVIYSKSI